MDGVLTMQGMQNQHEAPHCRTLGGFVAGCTSNCNLSQKGARNSHLPERLSSCQQHVAWLGLH